MPLASGSRIGPFEIHSPLGAGGMGEVYRAHDTRLNRDVALKLLPDLFADDPERLARFKREAQVLAALNHPHIGAIYGLEEGPSEAGPYPEHVGAGFSRPVLALVLELVEGPTLADRIAEGPMPVDEALPVARQIAEALEAAHQHGIIHRDLKPANIKLRDDGFVKVLDFGLAKLTQASESGPQAPALQFSASPTITTPAATGVGMILGTAAYMAPEQARGKAVDKRADVWAFGCVLYEMLTGRRAFPGEDVTETIAGVVKGEPDWSVLPAGLSPAIYVFLRRCLAKNPADRVHDVGDMRLAMDGAFDVPATASSAAAARMRSSSRWPATAAVALVMVGLTTAATWWFTSVPPERPAPLRRFAIATGEASLWIANRNRDVAISPDGTRIAYFAGVGGSRQLYIRALDALEAIPIREAERSFEPFFSPDGRWVAFNDESDFMLRKMPIAGGPPVAITKIGIEMLGATWSPDDTIVFATTEIGTGLRQVSAGGGSPMVLTTPDKARGEILHTWPEFLPGGRAILFTIQSGSRGDDFQVAALDVASGEIKIMVPGGSSPRFSPSGHLIYGVESTIRAVAFDPVRLEVLSDPFPVVDGVVTKASGGADFAVSVDGTLVYVAGTAGTVQRRLVWADRDGTRRPLNAPPRAYAMARLSPDGTRVALEVRDQQNDIWIWDIIRETLMRLTADPAIDMAPLWMPDGRRIAFTSGRVSPSAIFIQPADGTGAAERLTETTDGWYSPATIAPDGTRLVFQADATNSDLRMLLLDSARRAVPLLATPFNERSPAISPDGQWIAYESPESGQGQVYVRPFPDVARARWQISTTGGVDPAWAPDGRELFYGTAEGRLMTVDVRTEGGFRAGVPRVILDGGVDYAGGQGRSWDVSRDGKRFLLIEALNTGTLANTAGLTVVLNWSEELKRLAPSPP